jgi:hypothetical protein
MRLVVKTMKLISLKRREEVGEEMLFYFRAVL